MRIDEKTGLPVFTDEDFEGPGCECHCSSCCECITWPSEKIAKLANEKLHEWLRGQPEVRGHKHQHLDYWFWQQGWPSEHGHTHTAILVGTRKLGGGGE